MAPPSESAGAAAPRETSSLLEPPDAARRRNTGAAATWRSLLGACMIVGITMVSIFWNRVPWRRAPRGAPTSDAKLSQPPTFVVADRAFNEALKEPCSCRFPSDFVWGTATSSYQVEGAVDEGGRGRTIWDEFCEESGTILDNSTGGVACDHYHRYREDIQLMKSIDVRAYRFSIAWSRILPTGQGFVNYEGIAFYNRLIDELLANGIEPWVTIYHWDLPWFLEKEYGGWLSDEMPDIFAEYARVVFKHFGDRVKAWITINEPWSVAIGGYASGLHAPGHQSPTEPYIVAHHLLLAHAKAVKVYRTEFDNTHRGGGILGMASSGDFRYPLDPKSHRDRKAAERAILFQLGWLTDPVFFGDYPKVMRERLGKRLPGFTEHEQKLLRGSVDFVGLNYYSSFLATEPKEETSWRGYWSDIFVHFADDESWEMNAMGWNVAPEGLREMLLWIKERYNDPIIYITENGSAENEPNLEIAMHDEKRRAFYEDHLRACAQAIHAKARLKGFFAWSLMDNFEWQFGYQRRFGLHHVDFDTQVRTPKSSALWYSETIRQNGRNIWDAERKRQLAQRVMFNRKLPDKVLIGYGSDIDSVRRAIHQGVNVVIWAFADIVRAGNMDDLEEKKRDLRQTADGIRIKTNLDLAGIRCLRTELCKTGYGRVLHLVSIGGWNGPHLDELVSALEWFNAFKELVGDVFDGIDWDLEGHDRMRSPSNFFTTECLHKMGRISQMAKTDGYVVSMAPPQSYLDFHGNDRFSRYTNLTDPDRDWHSDFTYFGANVYAFLLAKYNDWIDLVSIQFYESYSRAAMMVKGKGMSAPQYFIDYIKSNLSLPVEFSSDPDISTPDQLVHLPLSKLVFGFANGWTNADSERTLYVSPQEIKTTWEALSSEGRAPKGFMFWTIDRDGENDVFFAHELSQILRNYSFV